MTGGDGDDIMFGQDGDDTLLGGAGNDKLFGNKGKDTLDGGPGKDKVKKNGNDGGNDGHKDRVIRLDNPWLGGFQLDAKDVHNILDPNSDFWIGFGARGTTRDEDGEDECEGTSIHGGDLGSH